MSVTGAPSEQLSEQIVEALAGAGLLRPEKRTALAAKIATGTMAGADWANEVELAVKMATKA